MNGLQLRLDTNTLEGLKQIQVSLDNLKKLLPQRTKQSLTDFEAALNVTKLSLADKESSIAKVATEVKKLGKSTDQFEAFMIKDLIKAMRKSMPTENLGPMGNMALDMFDQAVSDSLSQRRQFGLSQLMLGELSNSALAQESYRLTNSIPTRNTKQ